MNSIEFIELQKKTGLEFITTGSIHWMNSNKNYAVSSPALEFSNPTLDDLEQILSKKNIWFVNFICEFTENNTNEYSFTGSEYKLENFSSKIRNQIRKSLKSCEIKVPSFEEIVSQGIIINRETLSLHNRTVVYLTNEDLWMKYVKELMSSKDVYVYGAYVEGKLAAYAFFIKVNDKYYIYHPFSSRIYSKSAPMNGLLFTAINDFIKHDDTGVDVSYGLASFFSMQGLDKFKKGMLFKEEPVSRITVIDSRLSIFFNKYINKVFFVLSKINFINPSYNKYSAIYKSSLLFSDYKKNL